MGITREEIDLQELFRDLGKICKIEDICGKCAYRACLVGYSKDCAAQCRVNKQTFVSNGLKRFHHWILEVDMMNMKCFMALPIFYCNVVPVSRTIMKIVF